MKPILDQVSSGGYKYIHPSDIENYMDELTKSGHYDFFDQDKFEITISTLHSHKKQLETFAEKNRYSWSKNGKPRQRIKRNV